MVYTGCFRRFKFVPNPLSIAGLTPSWVGEIPKFKKLAPPKDLVYNYKDNKITQEEYTIFYNTNILSQWNNGFELLFELSFYGPEITMLCYEEFPQFCHRHLVANFIFQTTNIKVYEYEYRQQ